MSDKKGKKNLMNKLRENPWIISTVILAVVVIIFLFGGMVSGTTVSEEEAGEVVLDFANQQTGGGVELVGVDEKYGLYEVTVLFQGQNLPLYVSKDGKNLIQGVLPLEQEEETETPSQKTPTQAQEIPKSDEPSVELFIWSYCPYGVQAQSPLAEVVSLLGDSVDATARMYYDGHGAYENQQNRIQACIQKLAPEKYWEYAADFAAKIYPKCGPSRDIDCDKNESAILMKVLGIDSDKVMECADTEGQALIDADSARAKSLGVTGSPTLIVNGVRANVARNAEAFKTAICGAFNNAPEGCGETLSADAAAAAGSC